MATRIGKATLRRNGRSMITIRIKHNVGRDNIVHAILENLSYEPDAKFTRTSVWADVLNNIESKGDNWYPEGPDVEEMTPRAEQIGRRLFPELF